MNWRKLIILIRIHANPRFRIMRPEVIHVLSNFPQFRLFHRLFCRKMPKIRSDCENGVASKNVMAKLRRVADLRCNKRMRCSVSDH